MSRFRFLFYLFTAIVSVVFIFYAVNLFPIPGTDSRVFIPPALLYAQGYGLANPLYGVGQFTDLTHTGRFNYYVPLFSWLLGALTKIKPEIRTVFTFCALFSIANLVLYARFLSGFVTTKTGSFLKAIVLLSVAYVATLLLPTVGRPENITTLLAFLLYILYYQRERYSVAMLHTGISILLAMMLSTQIMCFYFAFLFLVTYELIHATNVFRVIVTNTFRMLVAVMLFCLFLAVSPNGFTSTVKGIWMHIFNFGILERGDGTIKLLAHYWLFAPLSFGFLFIFLAAATFYAGSIYGYVKALPMVKKILLLIVQLFIVGGFMKFVIYAAPAIYNATQFILPISAYLLINILSLRENPIKRPVTGLAFITYLAGALVFLRGLLLFIDYKADGKDYVHARPQLSHVLSQHPGAYITVGLWPLVDTLNNIRFFDGVHFKKDDIIVVQQVYLPFPPELRGKCTIIYDWGTTERRKVLGIPLTNSPQGYSFLVCRVN